MIRARRAAGRPGRQAPVQRARRGRRRKARIALGMLALLAGGLPRAPAAGAEPPAETPAETPEPPSLPVCATVPFRIGLTVSAIDYDVEDPYARIPPAELASYLANALRATGLFAGIHLDSSGDYELALDVQIRPLKYRSDRVRPELEMVADIEFSWADRRERYWQSRYEASSAYEKQAMGPQARFNLNLRIAARSLAAALARDLNQFFEAGGLAKVAFRRDFPEGTPLAPVLVLMARAPIHPDLLRRLQSLVAGSLCLEAVRAKVHPASPDDPGWLSRTFGLTLDGPESGLAVIGAPESAGTMRLIAVDLSRQTVLQEILLPELATRSESVETGLEQLVAALMAAHHASGTCSRQDHASTLRGP